jgi:hypothetical protein
MAFGPIGNIATFLVTSYGLNGLPSKESVVPDEWSHLTTAHGVPNRRVNEVREECDTVFKVIVRYLHHTRGVLNDGNFRREKQLCCAVE